MSKSDYQRIVLLYLCPIGKRSHVTRSWYSVLSPFSFDLLRRLSYLSVSIIIPALMAYISNSPGY
jgi:hypothetical protein